MKKINNQLGLTLIEIIIAISLMFLVASIAYSNLDFNLNLFSRGSVKSQMQYDARKITDDVSESLRFAYNLEFANSYGGTNCIQTNNLDELNPYIDTIKFDYLITFITTDDRKLVAFTISITHIDTNQSFELSTEVGLLNSEINLTDFPPNTVYNVAVFDNP